MNNNSISVVFADSSHAHYAQRICDLIYESALQRAHDVALATLAHTQSLHFRRRVWQSAPIGCDDPAAGDASS